MIKNILAIVYFLVVLGYAYAEEQPLKIYLPDEYIEFNYLDVPTRVKRLSSKEDIAVIAKKALLESPLNEQYQLDKAFLDDDPGMEEANRYYYVHFVGVDQQTTQTLKTFLVVINKFDLAVHLTLEYVPPTGDSFYRYHQILKMITASSAP